MNGSTIEGLNAVSQLYTPEPPPEGVLYHYTDFAGLKGILESHSLRATYNRCMNDASEQLHAERILQEEAARLRVGPIRYENRRAFLVCFCESSKLLSMWRSYAGNAGGYCLGFEYPKLKSYLGWQNLQVGQSVPLLTRVHYGNTPESIRKYLTALPAITDLSSNSACLPPFFSSIIKHEAFAEEREWRIIALDPPLTHIRFRPGTGNIKPYVELFWREKPCNRLPLVSVTFGPTLRREDRPEEIIGWMLEQNGYTDVTITDSEIPFRL